MICGAFGVQGSPKDFTELKTLCADHAKNINASEMSQWLSLSQTMRSGDLKGLDEFLASKSFLVGTKFSLADAAVYVALMTAQGLELAAFTNIRRYVDHVQCLCKHQDGVKLATVIDAPTLIPIGTGVGASAVAKIEEKKTEGGDPAAKEGAKNEEKAGMAGKKAAASAPAAEELDPSKLDIRVGEIKKCWNHPDSEKLLCEEVDLGEEAVRNIASGIRTFYNADEFVGKKVMVLANLKDRAIAGFKSQGMVLCSCNEDHSKVAILEPPAGAKVGDKVVFGDRKGDAATPAQMNKKKILEKLAPLLKTNEKGEAFCGMDAFTIDGKAVISALANGIVS